MIYINLYPLIMKKLITFGLFILILASCTSSEKSSQENEAYIYSVHGIVGIESLGISLTHEHVMSRFGLGPAYIGEYDKDSLLMQVVPYLKEVKALGVKTILIVPLPILAEMLSC